MPSCFVNFDNKSKGIYYSGQTITGNVAFENEKSRKFNSIFINLEGFAKVKNIVTAKNIIMSCIYVKV